MSQFTWFLIDFLLNQNVTIYMISNWFSLSKELHKQALEYSYRLE